MWTRRCWTITFGIECEAETKGITERPELCYGEMELRVRRYGRPVYRASELLRAMRAMLCIFQVLLRSNII
jgi:hypothetical protein